MVLIVAARIPVAAHRLRSFFGVVVADVEDRIEDAAITWQIGDASD
ncbi:hypothetical protein [Duganella violaceipulchra]|uniref:Uncharacterized protein n=1 Tax=Duganella violaceipulchra TaxID=2849652 RepID=A0AA41L2G3_9BURK|nr:hypothetical protein [Duganella violaceicalia]MBV6320259.1 hypothetical protein [Duganella violaceicalia]MCP2011708.1 hypothetical protein [Duganella violaceicalia]